MSGRLTAGAVLLALALTGCGDSEGGGGESSGWPTGGTPQDPAGLVYAVGDAVHLGDGSTLEVGADIDRFVVAGAGVYFTTEDGDALSFSAGDGTSREVAPDATELLASPDGRYLMLLDMVSGEKDGFGTPQAEVVVVDAVQGEEIARATDAMGDPHSDDDLADLYEDAEPGLLGFADGRAYYDGAGDDIAIDLETGSTSVATPPEGAFDLPPYDDRLSPDGAWRIVDVDFTDPARSDRFQPTDGGAPVRPQGVPGGVELRWWIDDTTAGAIAVDGGYDAGLYADGTTATLATCVVPSGECTPVAGTSGVTVHLPEGTSDGTTLVLPGG